MTEALASHSIFATIAIASAGVIPLATLHYGIELLNYDPENLGKQTLKLGKRAVLSGLLGMLMVSVAYIAANSLDPSPIYSLSVSVSLAISLGQAIFAFIVLRPVAKRLDQTGMDNLP